MASFPEWRAHCRVAAGATLLLGLLAAAPAAAQAGRTMALVGSDPAAVTYPGPRYPGGPDSLNAALRRLRPATAAGLRGEQFLHLVFNSAGHLSKADFLASPTGPTPSGKQARALGELVARQLPTWLPGVPIDGQPPATLTSLTLPVGPAATSDALQYSAENPLFPARFNGSQPIPSLLEYLQRQVRYPAEALRQQNQGTVYAYFEVSETGAVEQRRVAGSISPALNAEVLRVLQSIPDASTPPRDHGRPVRVFYLLPLRFKLQ